jgi:nitroreductase
LAGLPDLPRREHAIVDIQEALSGRRSIREYTDEPVHEATLRALVLAATQAPSAMNEQPWSFTVVRDQALLARISRDAKACMLATMESDQVAGARMQRLHDTLGNPDFHVFYHAPALVVIGAREPGGWVTEDCAMAAQNLMLAAHALALGSCWIGFAQAYLNTPGGRQAIGAPASSVTVAPIIVGHPRSRAVAVPRKEASIRWLG